jgi:hypothetical protein
MKLITAIVLSAFTLLAATDVDAAERYVFVGDSLVDNQNSFAFTKRLNDAGVAVSVTPLTPLISRDDSPTALTGRIGWRRPS